MDQFAADVPEPDVDLVPVTVVMIGSFNPAICTSAWLEANAVVEAGELHEQMNANPFVSEFSSELFDAQVTPNRFLVRGGADGAERMRRLLRDVFTILSHTPISLVGVRREILVASDGSLPDSFASFVPESRWEALGEVVGAPITDLAVQFDGTLPGPGHLEVTVREEQHLGRCAVEVSEEYPIEVAVAGATRSLEVLDEMWEPSEGRAQRIVQILSGEGADD